MVWVGGFSGGFLVGVFVTLAVVLAVLVLTLLCTSTPTLDPREFGDRLDPALNRQAEVEELVELAAQARKEIKHG